MNRVLIITDNQILLNSFRDIVLNDSFNSWEFNYACSSLKFANNNLEIQVVIIKEKNINFFREYSLIISLHCQQLFPEWLFTNINCINVHPGLNPYNRGWYPQIFSILNGLPIGATIHEIDAQLDHGNIIVQKEIKHSSWDNSYTLYQRIIAAEISLLKENLKSILDKSYDSKPVAKDGNLNLKIDFENLLKFDLNKIMTGQEFLNYTRAMTHNNFNNLYYIDPATNMKVYIKIKLDPEFNDR